MNAAFREMCTHLSTAPSRRRLIPIVAQCAIYLTLVVKKPWAAHKRERE
jgi:hypothetical protein